MDGQRRFASGSGVSTVVYDQHIDNYSRSFLRIYMCWSKRARCELFSTSNLPRSARDPIRFNDLRFLRLYKHARCGRLRGNQMDHTGDGATIFRHACGMDLEGIVSKRVGSLYVSGRTRAWLKTKNPDFERR